MLMADTMAVFFVTVGLMVSFVGLWLLARGLWPDRSAAAAARLERGLAVPFLVGLPVAAVFLLAAAVVANAGGKLGGVVAVGIVCLFFTYSSVGASGLATLIGRRLSSHVDAASPWRATLRGGVVLVLAYLAPVLGWFAIMPITTVIGCGATTLALMRRADAREPVAVFATSAGSPS
jgi:hypothetical protein